MHDKVSSYLDVVYKKLTAHQAEAIKWVFFTLGIFFAFLFPKTAKRLRPLLAIGSFIMILPSVYRLIAGLCRDVKRLTA